ncbi:MAG: deoxyribonuclease IV [Gemmatimonadetes bacterium]|nr:deoxyribonuclease IV [Gemmatimonadota bacterium]
MHFFGAHTVATGGIHMAAARAGAAGMHALQVFSAMPQFYNDKATVKPEKAARFTEAMVAAGIDKQHCIVHAAYVLNTASPEPEKYERARLGLAKELERTTALGVLGFCFHPGSAGSSDPVGAAERVGDAMAFALDRVPESARIFIENTAGAGRTMGRTPEEIAAMLARIPAGARARAGYGLDTCHLFASGHDFVSSPEAARQVLDHFAEVIGEPPSFLHLNDSEGELGSNKDRHALIGEGKVGVDPFRWLLRDPRTHGIPLILETPQANPDIAEGDATADPNDVRMMALLRSLAA